MDKKKIEKYIFSIIAKYREVLLLQRHTFELEYPTKSKEALAECVCNYPYLNVRIRYSEKLVEDWKKGRDIVPFIVHEMCHVITDPIYCKSIARFASERDLLDERELLTDYICNIAIINRMK